IQITVDTYGHLIPGANRGAVDRLDDAPDEQPVATQAQPDDDVADDAFEDEEDFLEKSGEPRRNRTFNPQIKRSKPRVRWRPHRMFSSAVRTISFHPRPLILPTATR